MTVQCPVCSIPFDRKEKFVRHVTEQHPLEEALDLEDNGLQVAEKVDAKEIG